MSRPLRTWKWRCGTDWPACSSQWGKPHWVPFSFSSGEVNSPCGISPSLRGGEIYGAKAPPHVPWDPGEQAS